MTYDGIHARSYLDGRLDVREPQNAPGRNPFLFPGGLLKGDADFTVGAVSRPGAVVAHALGFHEVGAVIANPFVGLIGGLLICNRALADDEISSLVGRPPQV